MPREDSKSEVGATRTGDRALVAVAADNGWLYGRTTWQDDQHRPVDGWQPLDDRPPRASSFQDIVDWLDFAHFEGVYRATEKGWTALLACWIAVEHLLDRPVPDPRGDGVLVAVRSAADVGALRTWFRAAKGTIADAVRADELSRASARQQLLEGLRRRAGDREVITGTGRRE